MRFWEVVVASSMIWLVDSSLDSRWRKPPQTSQNATHEFK